MTNDNKYVILLCGFSGAISGGDEHALQLIEHLNKRGKDVSVILPADAYRNRVDSSVSRIDIPNAPFEDKFRTNKVLLLLVYLWRILFSWNAFRNLSGKHNCVVIAASHLFHDTFPLLFQKRNSKEFVYAYHLIMFTTNRRGISALISSSLETMSLKVVKKRCVNVITSSVVVKDQLDMILGEKYGEILVTKNGVNVEMIRGVSTQQRSIDVLFCGRFSPHKGVPDLLKAIAMLPDGCMLNVGLIGSGPDLPKILTLLTELGLTNTKVLNNVDDNEKFRLMKSAKVLVLPSYEEGWGIVIGESLACGLRVVAYDINEIHSIWGEHVSWVDKGDINMLSTTIGCLLGTPVTVENDLVHWQTMLMWGRILDDEISWIEFRCGNNATSK
jgi:glycosyltransferase involved in cell wall biosynthesis